MASEIRFIIIPPEKRAKLGSKHGVSEDEVNDACTTGLQDSRWAIHPTYGRRLLVKGRTEHGRLLYIYLYPTPLPWQWRLGTAFAP